MDATILVAAGAIAVSALTLWWTMRKDRRFFQKDAKEQQRDIAEQLGGYTINLLEQANKRADRAETAVSEVVERTRREVERRCEERIAAATRELQRDMQQRVAEMERELAEYRRDRDAWREWALGRSPSPPPGRSRPPGREEG
jgi:hypothetical protein